LPAFYISLYSFLLLFLSTLTSASEPKETHLIQDKKIKLGMSNALSGPAASLGQELKKGANVYFNRLNQNGGINGSPVELISLDDGYEPENTVNNTKKLMQLQVLALFGYIGTPTSHAIMPILKKSKIPYLMPFTGADFLRSPNHSNILNLRASYYQELEAQVDYLIAIKKFKRVALVIQADEFGLSAQRAVNKILTDKALSLTLTARFQRNSNDIKRALSQLSEQPLDAVIFVGTYQPFINLINLANAQQLDVLFTSLSFIGSHNILNKLPPSSKVIISEVMPEPEACQWQVCQQFINDMNDAGYKELNRVQLEGYLNAFFFSQVAKRCEGNLTRQCLLSQFEQFNYEGKSLKFNFSQTNQGLQQVFFSYSQAANKQSLSPALTH